MPKSIPAIGEAMPTIDRRTLLQGLIVAAVTPAEAGAALHDPLLDVIQAYRAGLIEFDRLADNSPDDSRWKELGAATYEPWQAILDNWDQPARTREGAVEALRASLAAEDGVYGCKAAERMVRAALGYLENLPA
ncbi:hypothetical protein DEM27_28740 [Metarhizobium album]|uniref:Uncharacterized protein n=1 Tax=Metarhizobium album TaxID=2182425 RepID=A0A2U2DHL8_9HYPH|nr:hypothetical protein [Rhizobium album]PWE52792.1 hypothetical protein DEM27_28740 [Rhizobium album]